MEHMVRIPASRTVILRPDGKYQIKDEFVEIPLTESITRAFLSLLGTTPEEVVAAV